MIIDNFYLQTNIGNCTLGFDIITFGSGSSLGFDSFAVGTDKDRCVFSNIRPD